VQPQGGQYGGDHHQQGEASRGDHGGPGQRVGGAAVGMLTPDLGYPGGGGLGDLLRVDFLD